MEKPQLIGDIGGTNARFAITCDTARGYDSEQVYPCVDFPGLIDAIRFYLEQTAVPSPQSICLAVAGPAVGEQVKLTNNSWSISVGDLRREFRSETVYLLNDFEAIAYSIPEMPTDDLLSLGPSQPGLRDSSNYTVAVIGPGTGLGAAGLRGYEGRCDAIVSEASHAGFAPESSEQIELLRVLRERFERVSCERLVSGPGLENLYRALMQIHGQQGSCLTAREIFRARLEDDNPLANHAIDLFYEILGQVAGDLALSLDARNGVYIAGGITRRYPRLLLDSRFRTGFENKGRHRSLMEGIPAQLILHEQAGLFGASCFIRSKVSRL